MKLPDIQQLYWRIAVLLLILSFLIIAKGCKKDDNPTDPIRPQWQGLHLELAEGLEIQGKTIEMTVTAEGLDAQGNPTARDMIEAVVPNPAFPLDIPLPLYEPPCHWRITAMVTLMQDPPCVTTGEINVCQESMIELIIEGGNF